MTARPLCTNKSSRAGASHHDHGEIGSYFERSGPALLGHYPPVCSMHPSETVQVMVHTQWATISGPCHPASTVGHIILRLF